MSSLSEYKTALTSLVPGTHPLEQEELSAAQEKAISKAMDMHSRHSPQLVVEDMDGDGSFDYALSDAVASGAGLASWELGFSQVRQVEYPVDDDDESANVLENDEWTEYEKPAGPYLRFLSAVPATGESIRVSYTARHSCGETCTVKAADDEAVQSLAASYYCRILSAAYAQDQDSTISADVVDHKSRRKEFAALAKEYRAEYDEHMGLLGDTRVKPACAIQDLDVDLPGGGDRLTHPRRYR